MSAFLSFHWHSFVLALRAGVKWLGSGPVALTGFAALSVSLALLLLYGARARGFHIDGQYQLLGSAVLAGSDQVLGRDYSFYLGLIPSKILALFTGLSAGGFVALTQMLSLICWGAVIFLLVKILTRQRVSLAAVLLLYLVFVCLMVTAAPELRVLFPDNSALSYRFIFSLALFLLTDVLARRSSPPRILIAAIIAAMPLMSFDYGIPLGVIAGLNVAWIFRQNPRRVAEIGGLSLIIFLAMLLVFTKGHLFGYLERQAAIADGQYWYFETYGHKLYTIGQAAGRVWQLVQEYPSFAALLIYGLVICRRVSVVLAVAALLLAPLMLESVGHISNRYYRPLWAFGLCIALTGSFVRMAQWLWFRQLVKRKLSAGRFAAVTYAIVFVFIVFSWPALDARMAYRMHMNQYTDFIDVKTQGFFEALPPGQRIVSEYYNPLAHVYDGSVHTSSALAIHGLGEVNQRDWINRLRERDGIVAISTNPDFSDWQSWSVLQQAWFYDELVTQYYAAHRDDQYIVWLPREEKLDWQSWPGPCASLPTENPAINIIPLNLPAGENIYRITFTPTHTEDFKLWRIIWRAPFVETARAEDFGAPAYAETVSTILPGGFSDLQVIAFRGAGGETEVSNCRIDFLQSADPSAIFSTNTRNQLSLASTRSSQPMNFSDRNWQRGIFANGDRAGFLLSSDDPLADQYTEGVTIRFKDGKNYEITHTRRSEKYLEVWLSGQPLDPERHGYPSQFVVR